MSTFSVINSTMILLLIYNFLTINAEINQNGFKTLSEQFVSMRSAFRKL